MMHSKNRTDSHSLTKFHDSAQFDSGLGVSLKHDFVEKSSKAISGREKLPKASRAKDSVQLLSHRKRLQPYSLEQLAAAFESCPEEVDLKSKRLKYAPPDRWKSYSQEQAIAVSETCPEVKQRYNRQKYPPTDTWQHYSLEQSAADSESFSEEVDPRSKKQKHSTLDHSQPHSLEQSPADFEYFSDEVNASLKKQKHSILDNSQPHSLEQSTAASESCPDEVNRRSKRQRYPPLAHWRNQRLIYRFEKGQILCLGIDEGTPEDRGAIDSLNRSLSFKQRSRNRSNENISYRFLDDDREVSIQLAKHFNTVPWPEQYNMKPYRAKIVFKTEFCYFGYLQIDGSAAFKSQCLSEYDFQMTVVRGRVEVNIQCNAIEVGYKDTFFMPGGNRYWIKNLEKRKALLSFTFGKLKFLKSNIE